MLLRILILSFVAVQVSSNNPRVDKEEVKRILQTYTNDSALIRLIDDDCFLCAQLKCVLDEGPCNDFIGVTIKSIAPIVLKNNCANCKQIERGIVDTAIKYMSEMFPKEWNKILKRFM